MLSAAQERASDAEERIRRIFLEQLALEVPSADTDLFETGVVDSLTFVELLFHLEQEFGRRIALEELELSDLQTISGIARVMTRNGSGP